MKSALAVDTKAAARHPMRLLMLHGWGQGGADFQQSAKTLCAKLHKAFDGIELVFADAGHHHPNHHHPVFSLGGLSH